MTDSQSAPDEATDTAEAGGAYGVGPFTIREVSLLGVWLVAFLVSFFPVAGPGTPSVWTSGLLWILTIGVPTVAVGLIVLRRFSPDGIRRVGSLGVDQFASVAFSVAAVVWLQFVWSSTALAIEVGGVPGGWVQWVELVLMLAGVVLTVFAPLIPVFATDFRDRPEVPAQRAARPVRPVLARPAQARAPKPPREPKAPRGARRSQQPAFDQSGDEQGSDPHAYGQGYDTAGYGRPSDHDPDAAPPQGYDPNASGQQQGYDTAAYAQPGHDPNAAASSAGYDGGYGQGAAQSGDPFAAFAPDETAAQETGGYAPVSAPSVDQAPVQQAFWALAPVERDIVDQNGVPLFRVGPTAWALVIEDRGNVFVVRDEDGRTGFLLDVSGVMRG